MYVPYKHVLVRALTVLPFAGCIMAQQQVSNASSVATRSDEAVGNALKRKGWARIHVSLESLTASLRA